MNSTRISMRVLFSLNRKQGMKIITALTSTNEIDLLPDTALLRNNEAFYVPNFAHELKAMIVVTFHVNKIGKSVAPQFAERYVSGVSFAVWFRASNVERDCVMHAKSLVIARGFDKSFAVSPIVWPVSEVIDKQLEVFVNNQIINCSISSNDLQRAYELFAASTGFFTCKIGDMFFLDILPQLLSVEKGQQVYLKAENERLLFCEIK